MLRTACAPASSTVPLRHVLQPLANAQRRSPVDGRVPDCRAACAAVCRSADLSRPPLHRALADGPGVPRTASCPHRAQCRFALPDTAAPVFTSRPAARAARCWSAVQSACPGCPVYVLLPSPPDRTAQCHPSLPLCLITTVFEGARSLCGPRARAAGVCVAAQPACSGCTVFVPMVSPPVRTAQCHPSLPLCLITTVQENQGHCAVRVLGLHGACADGQSACSDCPMPPLLPVVSAATPT